MLKSTVKRVIEYIAAYTGKHRRVLDKPELLVLGYHRVLPKEHPDYMQMQPGMLVQPETFRMHIQILKKYFEIVDLNEWVNKCKSNQQLPMKAAAITFDDGWIDNYEYAFPILKLEKTPATIFLVSSMIDTSKQYWPERIGAIIDNLKNNTQDIMPEYIKWFEEFGINVNKLNQLDETSYEKLINNIKKYPDKYILDSLNVFNNLEENIRGDSSSNLSYKQLVEMKESSLISFGAHSRNHYRLNKMLLASDLEDEIIHCKKDLESRLDTSITGFCYPNGDYDDISVNIVRQTYDYACTIHKGWNKQSSDPYYINRILIHEDVTYDRISFESTIAAIL